MTTRVAINGLGRIGRATLRAVLQEESMELVAVNDIAPIEDLAYLLRHDTVYGGLRDGTVRAEGSRLHVGDTAIEVLAERDPAELPWRDRGVELVFECTGIFRREEEMRKHLEAGARRVILSAPARDEGVQTVVYGVNENDGAEKELVSTASCTTNCIAPVMEILDRRIGVRKAMMTTVHAYTSSQNIVDGPASKWRRGRAGAANIVPTTTGAAGATAKTVPAMAGIFDGVALRVPVPVGSISDITVVTRRETSVEEINDIFREEVQSERYQDVVGVSDDHIVSSDIIGDPHGSLVDLTMTKVTDGDLIKVMAWYDNEWGYAKQMVRHARHMALTPTGAGA